MDDCETKQILFAAENLLPRDCFFRFVNDLSKLLNNPFMRDWHAKQLKMFVNISDSENLASRLFKFWKSRGVALSYEFNFLADAHQYLDQKNFKDVLDCMMKFIEEGNEELQKQIYGYKILGILKKRENLLQRVLQATGAAVSLQFFWKFQFWFEMYFTLNLSRYKRLLSIMLEYRERGESSNANGTMDLKRKALEVLGPDEALNLRFLRVCTLENVNSPYVRSCTPIPDSVALEEHYLMNPVGPTRNPAWTPDNQSLVSDTPVHVQHKYPNQDSQSLNNQTLLGGQNYHVMKTHTAYNQTLISESPGRQNFPAFDLRTPNRTTQVSVEPVRHNYPVLNTQTPGYQTPKPVSVAESCFVQDTRTTKDSTPIVSFLDACIADHTQSTLDPLLPIKGETIANTPPVPSEPVEPRCVPFKLPNPAALVEPSCPVLDAQASNYPLLVSAKHIKPSFPVLDTSTSDYPILTPVQSIESNLDAFISDNPLEVLEQPIDHILHILGDFVSNSLPPVPTETIDPNHTVLDTPTSDKPPTVPTESIEPNSPVLDAFTSDNPPPVPAKPIEPSLPVLGTPTSDNPSTVLAQSIEPKHPVLDAFTSDNPPQVPAELIETSIQVPKSDYPPTPTDPAQSIKLGPPVLQDFTSDNPSQVPEQPIHSSPPVLEAFT